MASIRLLVVSLLLLGLFSACAVADVPPMISYQGKLMQPSGATVPDGTYSLQFAIYDVPRGGTALWSETNPGVQVKGGLFSVLLGSVNNLPANVFDSPDRFFGVRVGTDTEMTPRQKIASVGYAVKAGAADNGVPVGGVIMWSGAANQIPQGWALCDGTNGAPDLRDKFVVGAGAAYAVGASGGTAQVTLTAAQMPIHSHGVNDPGHQHSFVENGYVNFAPWSTYQPGAIYDLMDIPRWTASAQTGISIQNSGGDPVTHEIVAHENRPPYYALCFIMKCL